MNRVDRSLPIFQSGLLFCCIGHTQFSIRPNLFSPKYSPSKYRERIHASKYIPHKSRRTSHSNNILQIKNGRILHINNILLLNNRKIKSPATPLFQSRFMLPPPSGHPTAHRSVCHRATATPFRANCGTATTKKTSPSKRKATSDGKQCGCLFKPKENVFLKIEKTNKCQQKWY